MTQKELDKIKGMFYGFAIGDALGVGTEFMTRQEIRVRYPNGLHKYDDIIRDSHRSMFDNNDWTLDTEMLLSMADDISDMGDIDPASLGRRLKVWCNEHDPWDLASTIRAIIRNPEYDTDPVATSRRMWCDNTMLVRSNESLHRSLLAGIWPTDHIRLGNDLTALTHAHPICMACAQVMAEAAHTLFYQDRVPEYTDIVALARATDEDVVPYLRKAYDHELDTLELDDEETLAFVRKATAASLWPLWHDIQPADALEAIIAQGGDADTNAANAMALIGLRHGYEALPRHLCTELKQSERLDRSIGRFADAIDNQLKKQIS